MKQLDSYRRRFNKVINYIYDHLDEDLDINRLAEVACFSPYHFHRLYREMMGETVNNTVRRLRLQQAAAILIRTDLPIQRIASAVGYTSTEGFSRAFTKAFSVSPKAYRQRKQWSNEMTANAHPMLHSTLSAGATDMTHSSTSPETDNTYSVEVEHFEGQTIIGIHHQGDYIGIGKKFDQLFAFANTQQLLNDQTRYFGIYYDDPQSVAPEQLRSIACINVAEDYTIPESHQDQLIKMTIPAGECVNLLFKGPYAELEEPYQWLYGHWFPNSDRDVSDFPAFEEYLNDAKTTPPNELLTAIRCLLV